MLDSYHRQKEDLILLLEILIQTDAASIRKFGWSRAESDGEVIGINRAIYAGSSRF
jgi:S1-C subfamily serine protease